MEVKGLEHFSDLNSGLEIMELIPKDKIKKRVHIFRNAIKRMTDIFVSLIGVVCLIPLTLFIYIARKILKEDDGPVFYEQLRIGKNGKYFRIYKPIY